MLLDFKSFSSGASSIAGIEIVNIICKGQSTPELPPFEQFSQLVA
jgi:putative transposase